MKGLGLTLASLGLFLSMGIGSANAQCLSNSGYTPEFFGYVPSLNAPAPAEWFMHGKRMYGTTQTALVAPLSTSCAAPVAVTQCAAPVAVAAPTCAAPVAVAAPTCAAPVAACTMGFCDNPNLHGINGSLQVQPTVGFRGNNVIVQPSVSLIGGNNPYLAPVVQNSIGIIQPSAALGAMTNTPEQVIYTGGAYASPVIYNRF